MSTDAAAPRCRHIALNETSYDHPVTVMPVVLEFYVEREIHPEKWYPREADGTVRKYDDLPPQYHANVNIEPPFDRHVGDEPRLSGEEIDESSPSCRC